MQRLRRPRRTMPGAGRRPRPCSWPDGPLTSLDDAVSCRWRAEDDPADREGTMDWTERRERFRGILNGSRCFHPASVYDAMSARIAEDLGYEVGMLAGR